MKPILFRELRKDEKEWEKGNKLNAVKIIKNILSLDLYSSKLYCEKNFQ